MIKIINNCKWICIIVIKRSNNTLSPICYFYNNIKNQNKVQMKILKNRKKNSKKRLKNQKINSLGKRMKKTQKLRI